MHNKLKFTTIAVALLLTGAGQMAKAQVMIGPFIGFNLSTLTGDSTSGYNFRPGFNSGGTRFFSVSGSKQQIHQFCHI